MIVDMLRELQAIPEFWLLALLASFAFGCCMTWPLAYRRGQHAAERRLDDLEDIGDLGDL